MNAFSDILEAGRTRAIQADITAQLPHELPEHAADVGRLLGQKIARSEPISPIVLVVRDRAAGMPVWDPHIVGVTQRWAYYLEQES